MGDVAKREPAEEERADVRWGELPNGQASNCGCGAFHGQGSTTMNRMARAITPKKVDGLRITDRPTLDVVVSVLARASNTALAAALVALVLLGLVLPFGCLGPGVELCR